jgi:predicted ATPase
MEWESDDAYRERIATQAWRRRIKDWAVRNGWDPVIVRGRLPEKLREEYLDATGDDIAEILRKLRQSSGRADDC